MSGFDPYPSPDPTPSPDGNLVPREVPSTTVRVPRYGDPVQPATLDPQPIGMLQSGTIKTALIGGAAILTTLGVKRFALDDATAQAIADGVVALIAIVSSAMVTYYRARAASVVQAGASAPPAVREVAAARRDAIKSGGATSRNLPLIGAVVWAAAVVVTATGCQGLTNMVNGGGATTQPALMSPVVRVAVARQVYAGVLPSLTTAIDAGMFDSSPDTLRAIAATRRVLENALNQADALADAGKAADFNYWIAQVDAALSEFLKLTKPGTRAVPVPRPTTRPAARPTGLYESEVRWVPLKLPRYLRASPAWAAPSPGRSLLRTPGASCPTTSAPQSARPRPWLNSMMIARSATH